MFNLPVVHETTNETKDQIYRNKVKILHFECELEKRLLLWAIITVKALILVHPKSTDRGPITRSPLYELKNMCHHHDKVRTLSKVT